MRRLFIIIVALGITAGVAIAFSLITGTELTPKPPPRALPEAYAMALQALGPATNEYYCVDAKISRDRRYGGEWVFTFDKNSMQHKLVFVAMKSYKSVNPNYHLNPWPLTEVRDIGLVFKSSP